MTTTVKIKISDHEVELTIDEAQAIYKELGKLFGATKETVPLPCPYPVPYYPWTYPWEITCRSSTVTTGKDF